MTVWTPVSLDEANSWLLRRGFSEALAISPIDDGVEDSVFRLDFDHLSSCCLRLFERTEPLGPVSLAAGLAAAGLPTCPPLADPSDVVLAPLHGKPACLFPWIDGASVPDPSLAQIEEMGFFMGAMASASLRQGGAWQRANPRGWPWFEKTADGLAPFMEKSLSSEIQEELSLQRAFWIEGDGKALPSGAVHADLFRDNVLFHADGSLGAVIDWGFCASQEPFIYDLAIMANDWCLKDQSLALDKKKGDVFLSARESVLPLSVEEKTAWPMALRLASLRFYLSRLWDSHFPRHPDGKIHNPDHFGAMLRLRRG